MALAHVGDAGEILALQKLAFLSQAELYEDSTLAPLVQTIEEMLRDFTEQTFLKAVEGGRIVGSVRGRLEGGTCHVGRLVVHPQHQNRGIGSGLMRELEDLFAPRCDRFELFTGHKSEKSIRLYGSLGYETFRTQEVKPGLSLVYMEKRVPDHGRRAAQDGATRGIGR